MGKYMKKAKTTGEVTVMEVSQFHRGVLTRAKTLALQKLQQSPFLVPDSAASDSYLQLRNRRLEKTPFIMAGNESKRQKHMHNHDSGQSPRRNPNNRASSRLRVGSTASESNRSLSVGLLNDDGALKVEEAVKGLIDGGNNFDPVDLGVEETSFGENFLDLESREREGEEVVFRMSTRESTPCNSIRNPDTIRTPGSTTRQTSSTAVINRRIQNSTSRHIPTALELDEFFADVEEKQQRQFIEKYNFNPMNDTPLPGRYEWEKLDL